MPAILEEALRTSSFGCHREACTPESATISRSNQCLNQLLLQLPPLVHLRSFVRSSLALCPTVTITNETRPGRSGWGMTQNILWRTGYFVRGNPYVRRVLRLPPIVGCFLPYAILIVSRPMHDRLEDPPGLFRTSRLARGRRARDSPPLFHRRIQQFGIFKLGNDGKQCRVGYPQTE